jgi:hypothetical protein
MNPAPCRRPPWRLLPANDNGGELAVRAVVRLAVEDAQAAANDARALDEMSRTRGWR